MKKADRIYYGGDYNPDQWDDKTIEEDMRLNGCRIIILKNLKIPNRANFHLAALHSEKTLSYNFALVIL